MAASMLGQGERERIAGVLHDEVGQVVSAVGLQLELLRLEVERREPDLAARIAAIQKTLDGALAPLRRLVSEMDSASSAGPAAGRND